MPHIFIDDKEVRFAKSFATELQEEIGPKGKEFRIPKSRGRVSVMSGVGGESKQYHPPKGQLVSYRVSTTMEIKRNERGEITKAMYSEAVGAETVVIVYCDKVKKGRNENLNQYSPAHYANPGTIMPKDYMKYWLLIHSPFVKGGRAEKRNAGGKFRLEIYDAEQHFTREMSANRTMDLVKAKIRNDESQGGASLEKLREMAQVFFIPETAYTGVNHLRGILLETIENDQARPALSGDPRLFGYEYAYKLLQGDDENIEKKVQISRALEAGIIISTDKPICWFYRDKQTGTPVGKICDVAPTALSKEQALVSFFKMNPKEYTNFLEVMRASSLSTTVAVHNKENLIRMIDAAKEEKRHEDVLTLYDSLIALTNAPAYRTARKSYKELWNVDEPVKVPEAT